MIRTAMIFAAGRGERMRPLTDICPKPMLVVQGTPLIEHLVLRLKKAGITRIVINHAHLGSQIRHHLQDGKTWDVEIVYSPEPPGALETGGAIVKALPLLGKEPFICVSGDIFTDFPFETLHAVTAPAHLVLRPLSASFPKGDFGLAEGYVTNKPEYVYANIGCFYPDIFKNKQIARIRLAPWLRELAKEKQVTGEVFKGEWHNIGTVTLLENLHADKI